VVELAIDLLLNMFYLIVNKQLLLCVTPVIRLSLALLIIHSTYEPGLIYP
jgi:hypothetical protein